MKYHIIQIMNENPISPRTGQAHKAQNFYFLAIPIKLIFHLEGKCPYESIKIKIKKGLSQKITQTRKSIAPNFNKNNELQFDKVKLEFAVISYNPEKHMQYYLVVSDVRSDVETQLGEFGFDASTYIDQFIRNQNGAFTEKINISKSLTLQFQFYIEKTAFLVERLYRNATNPIKDNEEEKQKKKPIEKQKIERKPATRRSPILDEEEQQTREQIREKSKDKYKRFAPKKDSAQDMLKRVEKIREPLIKQQLKTTQQKMIQIKPVRNDEYEATKPSYPQYKKIQDKSQSSFAKAIQQLKSKQNPLFAHKKTDEKEQLPKNINQLPKKQKQHPKSSESAQTFFNLRNISIVIIGLTILLYFVWSKLFTSEEPKKVITEQIASKTKNKDKNKPKKSKKKVKGKK